MARSNFKSAFSLGLGLCLIWWLAPAAADPPGDWCAPDSPFGNAGTGDHLDIPDGGYYEMDGDEDWRHVTVGENATLNTQGCRLRVCGTLTNEGTITDWYSGGAGGPGGAHGKGHDPCEDDDPPHCDLQPLCTAGANGVPGDPPLTDQPGQNGRGGHGGGGGGGGGGAWRPLCIFNYDADGGNGGDGGAGGKGGGYVKIWAFRVDNQGVIDANGEPAGDGENAAPANGCPCQNTDCGPEHCQWGTGTILDPYRDISGGGGGGGGGGAGGNGGTVDIHYCFRVNEGISRAEGGAGGAGGKDSYPPGADPCCNDYGVPAVGHGEGCDGGAPNGGDGGDAEHEPGCAGDGDGGGSGAQGDPGDVDWIWHCPGPDHTDYNVLRYKLQLQINPDTEEIVGTNIMQIRCVADGLIAFGFRLDEQAFGDDTQVYIGPDWDGPWVPRTKGEDWDWADDEKTAHVALDHTYNDDEVFYLRVDYAGAPRTVTSDAPWPLPDMTFGMFFKEHGPEGQEVPIVFTSVEPWYAYLWWPVKDDTDNWNCDKARADFQEGAELAFTVPSWMVVASNGQYPPTVTQNGDWKTYTWNVINPVAAYLFSVAATNYDVIELPDYQGMPVVLYVFPEDNTPDNVAKWSKVIEMLAHYAGDDLPPGEGRYGPYPFLNEKYAICQWPPGHGAMEHQTVTGQLGNWNAKHAGFPGVEYVTCHELAHQWWGDNVTCATWHDIWLNEGFACYSEAIWFESQYWRNDIPGDEPQDTLAKYVMSAHRPQWPSGFSESVYRWDVSDAWKIFHYFVTYQKGPWVLHMLRHLSDPDYEACDPPGYTSEFFKILRTYREAQQLQNEGDEGCAVIPDFELAADTVFTNDGLYPAQYQSLDWFFDQWVYGGGAPAYRYAWKRRWLGGQWYAAVRLRQTQQIWFPTDPIFTMPIDIYTVALGGTTRHTTWNNEEFEEYWLPTNGLPLWIRFDPYHWVLRRWAVPWIWSLLVDIGESAGTSEPVARVNSLTQVAAELDTGNGRRAFLWLAEPYFGLDPGLTDLGTLGGTWSRPYGINEAGQIVGASEDVSGNTEAFVWLPEPDFGLEPGIHLLATAESVAVAHGINDFAQVVGYAGDSESVHQAVLWQYDQAGEAWVVTDLPSLGGDRSQAWAVNEGGQIAGWSKTAGGEQHAVVWDYGTETAGWTIMDLGTEGESSAAYGINANGDAVGYEADDAMLWQKKRDYPVPPPEPPYEPFVLPSARDPEYTDIAYGINNVGHVVGQSGDHAVLWLSEPAYGLLAGMTDLNDYPALASVTSCGALKVAWDINDAGQIVGCRDMDGPPAPPLIFVLALASDADCDGNEILDACDLLNCPPDDPDCDDCNCNGYPDWCDINGGFSQDLNGNGVPDECECCTTCMGDMLPECDGYVNMTDFTVFALAYFSQCGDPNYDPCADVAPPGGDGFVNVTDFTAWSVNFPGPCP